MSADIAFFLGFGVAVAIAITVRRIIDYVLSKRFDAQMEHVKRLRFWNEQMRAARENYNHALAVGDNETADFNSKAFWTAEKRFTMEIKEWEERKCS